MDIVKTYKESIDVAKTNPLILAPLVAVGLVMAVLSLVLVGGFARSAGMMGGMGSPAGAVGAMAGAVFFAAILGVVGMVLYFFAHGMTVGMANEAIETGTTSLGGGISVVTSRLPQLIVAALIVGLAVGIGMLLLVIPGIVAAFFLAFTFPLVIIENMPAVDAVKKSIEIVKANLNDVVIMFLIAIVIGVVSAIVGGLLRFIPVVGPLAASIINGIFGGYVTIVVVKVFIEIARKSKGTPAEANP
ncbi:MAG: hypothetical protein EPN25_01165 [Nitrospirae bacterium]|nr:MAG: hypothetical protein EPN25_01165 [Nitrospirota bacterium]